MSVNRAAPREQSTTVEADLLEFVRLMQTVVSAVKRGGATPSAFEEAFERGSLGPRHGGPLITVALEGTLSVSELAERLGLSLSATSLMVGELSRAGLLERIEDENDRRRTMVRLNEEIRDDISAFIVDRTKPLRRALERLSPRVRANFIDGMRVLAEESERAGAGREAAGS